MVGNETQNVILHSSSAEGKNLSDALKEFVDGFGDSLPQTFALLYSPSECVLAKLSKSNGFEYVDEDGNPAAVDLKGIFEARIFNREAELRWFNDNGNGVAATLSETVTEREFGNDVCLTNPQKYLLWGEVSPNNQAPGDWTEFAEARIGKFYVPITTTSRACFTAIEYLKSFDDQDGNVAVFDERLTGISEVK